MIALGIGTHVNMAELLQMTGDSELAFDNQTLTQSVDRVSGMGGELKNPHLVSSREFSANWPQPSSANLHVAAMGRTFTVGQTLWKYERAHQGHSEDVFTCKANGITQNVVGGC